MKKVFYFMGQLNDDDLQWILKNGKKERIEKNDVLIQQYEPIDRLFIVLDGKFNIIYNNMKIAELSSGEIVGEMSFVDSAPPVASVVAMQKSHVVSIRKELINRKIKEDTGFAARFFYALSLFLVDRLRSNIQLLGYGNTSMQQNQSHDDSEIDPIIMDSLSSAGERFQRILRKFK